MPLRVVYGLGALLGLVSPSAAQDCRLALVLALDVSSSVDASEDRLQRQGLARALMAPEVVLAFMAGGPVALYAFEWAGQDSQVPILPGWQMVTSEGDLARVASLIEQSQGSPGDLAYRRTALGAALGHAVLALGEAPGCRAHTIDVAGDGESNEGFEPEVAYETYPFDGVTVNALVIGRPMQDGRNISEARPQPRQRSNGQLVSWFEHEVLHGPGAFWVLANGYQDYERAMRAKLLRELALPAMSGWPASEDAG